jgi:hypothetical protein
VRRAGSARTDQHVVLWRHSVIHADFMVTVMHHSSVGIQNRFTINCASRAPVDTTAVLEGGRPLLVRGGQRAPRAPPSSRAVACTSAQHPWVGMHWRCADSALVATKHVPCYSYSCMHCSCSGTRACCSSYSCLAAVTRARYCSDSSTHAHCSVTAVRTAARVRAAVLIAARMRAAVLIAAAHACCCSYCGTHAYSLPFL